MSDSFLNSPILVYGPRKGGTTLFQSLLDGHPNILMLPGELKVKYNIHAEVKSSWDKLCSYLSEGRSLWQNTSLFTCLHDSRKIQYDLLKLDLIKMGTISLEQVRSTLDLEAYINQLTNLSEREINSTGDIYCLDVEAFHDSIWEPTVYKYWACKEVGGKPEFILPYFRSLFPKAKLMLIGRSPHFVVRSVLRDRRRRKNRHLSLQEIFDQCYQAWHVMRVLAQAENWANTMVVLYENLVLDTETVMSKVCEFLELPFEDSCLVPSTLGINSVVSTSSVATKQVFQEAVQDWKDELTRREIFAIRAYTLGERWFNRYLKRPAFSYEALRNSQPGRFA